MNSLNLLLWLENYLNYWYAKHQASYQRFVLLKCFQYYFITAIYMNCFECLSISKVFNQFSIHFYRVYIKHFTMVSTSSVESFKTFWPQPTTSWRQQESGTDDNVSGNDEVEELLSWYPVTFQSLNQTTPQHPSYEYKIRSIK